MSQKIVSHWYKYQFNEAWGTICGRKITQKTNMVTVIEKTTCKKCKEALKKAKRRSEQREMGILFGV